MNIEQKITALREKLASSDGGGVLLVLLVNGNMTFEQIVALFGEPEIEPALLEKALITISKFEPVYAKVVLGKEHGIRISVLSTLKEVIEDFLFQNKIATLVWCQKLGMDEEQLANHIKGNDDAEALSNICADLYFGRTHDLIKDVHRFSG